MTTIDDQHQLIQNKSKYLWLIDAGHGGMLNGRYTTAPAKMWVFPDHLHIYEGVINRQIADRLALLLSKANIDWKYVHDVEEDTSLSARVKRADNTFFKDKRAIYLSIHSNSGGGSGFEIFTSIGQTKSDKVADIFCHVYKKIFSQTPFRKDNLTDHDDDKEADFYVLRKTDCPAILVENLFFDNREEAEFLLTPIGQEAIANCLFDCIETCEAVKPI